MIDEMGWLIIIPIGVGIFLLYNFWVDFNVWRDLKEFRKHMSIREQFSICGKSLFYLILLIVFMFILSETAFADDSNSSLCQEYLIAEKELNMTFPKKRKALVVNKCFSY